MRAHQPARQGARLQRVCVLARELEVLGCGAAPELCIHGQTCVICFEGTKREERADGRAR